MKTLYFRARRRNRYRPRYPHALLAQGLSGYEARSDISDHLGTIFFFAADARPSLIVELGTRGGESTRALLSAARLFSAPMLSIDIDDCGGLGLPYRENWTFVRGDDVAFGEQGFAEWCADREMPAQADVIFIDTSHEYEHTQEELRVWSRHLSPKGVMILHDTNMGGGVYGRLDGSVGKGWNNRRGVIRAVEEFVGRRYDERTFFDDVAGGFLVKHFPHCNGLTVLKRFEGEQSREQGAPLA